MTVVTGQGMCPSASWAHRVIMRNVAQTANALVTTFFQLWRQAETVGAIPR
jgi:hypothetical protein